jgi:hypothetical protein
LVVFLLHTTAKGLGWFNNKPRLVVEIPSSCGVNTYQKWADYHQLTPIISLTNSFFFPLSNPGKRIQTALAMHFPNSVHKGKYPSLDCVFTLCMLAD